MPEPITRDDLDVAAHAMEGGITIPETASANGVDLDSLASVCSGMLDSILEAAAGDRLTLNGDAYSAAALAFLTGALVGVRSAHEAAGREADRG